MRNHEGPTSEQRGGPPPRRQRSCKMGGLFKFFAIVLLGVHFWSLHKFRKALDTIKGSKMTTKVQDGSAISVAPTSVPITMVPQQIPSNYMVV